MNKTRIILTAALAFATFFGVGMRNERTCEAVTGFHTYVYHDTRVLAIGVDEYESPDIRDLQFAGADAKLLGETWKKFTYYDEAITVLTSDGGEKFKPTRENILRVLWSDVRTPITIHEHRLMKPIRYFVAFFGHSIEIDGETYFAPSDARLDEKGDWIKETLISADEIREKYGESRRKYGYGREGIPVFFLADIELSLRGWEKDVSFWSLGLYGPEEEDARRSQRLAQAFSSLGGSPATHAFVEALSERGDLDGDGVVTCLEAALYTKRRTREFAFGRNVDVQKPRLVGCGEDFPLVVWRKKEAKDEKTEKLDGASR